MKLSEFSELSEDYIAEMPVKLGLSRNHDNIVAQKSAFFMSDLCMPDTLTYLLEGAIKDFLSFKTTIFVNI